MTCRQVTPLSCWHLQRTNSSRMLCLCFSFFPSFFPFGVCLSPFSALLFSFSFHFFFLFSFCFFFFFSNWMHHLTHGKACSSGRGPCRVEGHLCQLLISRYLPANGLGSVVRVAGRRRR
ncbi:hypothetical protein B0T22DRAFT_460844 [Podospora appendiculata]|uniref:Uncharacterized protein n=1 Tax=Podospora appendiculata TaxID=314037 RepID=A0AAE0XAW0_9PEZI|nr:hypothetical protein B0T22DRAFT_460844 [Podospora appendiculata]